MSTPDWRDQAACLDHPDPSVFTDELTYPLDKIRVRAALLLCKACPVQQECLRTVRPSRVEYDGVAGGTAWHRGKILDTINVPTNRALPPVDQLTRERFGSIDALQTEQLALT